MPNNNSISNVPILDSQLVSKVKLELKMKEETIKELRNQLKYYQETQCSACLANRSYHAPPSDDEHEEDEHQHHLQNYTITKTTTEPGVVYNTEAHNLGLKNDWLAPATTGRRQSIQLNNIYESEIQDLIAKKK